jgi:hypothetical protein
MCDMSRIIAIGRAGPAFRVSGSQIQVFSPAGEGLLLLNVGTLLLLHFGRRY